MTAQLKVGLIGCGEAVQTIHTPAINSLPKQFRINACCDISNLVVEEISARTG